MEWKSTHGSIIYWKLNIKNPSAWKKIGIKTSKEFEMHTTCVNTSLLMTDYMTSEQPSQNGRIGWGSNTNKGMNQHTTHQAGQRETTCSSTHCVTRNMSLPTFRQFFPIPTGDWQNQCVSKVIHWTDPDHLTPDFPLMSEVNCMRMSEEGGRRRRTIV